MLFLLPNYVRAMLYGFRHEMLKSAGYRQEKVAPNRTFYNYFERAGYIVTARIDLFDEKMHVRYAFCSPNDRFVKKVGREIASSRTAYVKISIGDKTSRMNDLIREVQSPQSLILLNNLPHNIRNEILN